MHMARGRGAFEPACPPSAGASAGQGATEYLVLLAAVLIVALVSVALLGFFPGMATDAQIRQSQVYWQSATPIAVTEVVVAVTSGTGEGTNWPYIRIRNTGNYPIRITKMIGANGTSYVSTIYCTLPGCVGSTANMSDFFYLSPGEESYFANAANGALSRTVLFIPQTSSSSGYFLAAFSSGCKNSSSDPGTLVVPTLGFEYVTYIEGQQITKRQIGAKPLVAKCRSPY